MSEEQLKAFIAKVQSDTSLQEQLKAPDADPIAVANSAGFTVNAEDLQAYASSSERLSDDELESAAGGFHIPGANCGAFWASLRNEVIPTFGREKKLISGCGGS